MPHRNDNRHFYRMMINAAVKVFINDPETAREIDGICRDLSASGMAVEIDEPLEMGILVKVRLESPDASVAPLDAIAKVMRCTQENEDCYQLGLAFIELN